MRWASFFLCLFALATACVVEDKQVIPPIEAGVEAGVCVLCPEDKPVCLDETECVQCAMGDDEQDYCTERNQVCDFENHECVDCLSNAECTDPNASRCDTDDDACAPCETNEDCDGVDGLAESGNACDEDRVCVECTPESEAETCPNDKSCNPRTKTCTETTVGSRGVCETCVADSECDDQQEPAGDYKCVPMTYDGEPFPNADTGFCLKTTDGGCERPYAITLSGRGTLSEPSSNGDYCGINELLTTCPAVAALVADKRCPNGMDEECEPSGICRQVGNLQNRCTYLCSDVVECKSPPVPGSTCGSSSSGGDKYCGG